MGSIGGRDGTDTPLPPETMPGGGAAPAAWGAGSEAFPPPRQAWFTVSVLALATTFALLDQGILGLLIQQIKVDFQLSDTQAGWLLGPAFVLFYAAFGVPLSRYIDRLNRTKIIAAGIFIWSMATAACGLAASFMQLFIARVFVGAGEAVNGPAAYSIIADCFSRDRLPRAVATMQIGSVAGSGLSLLLGGAMIWLVANIGNPVLPVVGQLRPWQVVMMGVGLPGVFVSLLLLTKVKEPPRRNLRMDTRKVPLSGAVRYLGLHFAVYGPMFLGLTLGSLDRGNIAWGAAFFERTYGWSPAQYGITQGIVSIIAMLSGLYLGARWVDRMQARGLMDAPFRVILYTRAVALPFAIAMPLMPTPELAIAASAVSFLTLGMSGPMLNAVLLIITPNEIRGQVMAMYLFIFTVVAQGLAPLITGMTTDYLFTSPGDLRYSILLLHLVFLPTSLIVTWLGWKPYRREVERLNAEDAAAGRTN